MLNNDKMYKSVPKAFGINCANEADYEFMFGSKK